MVCGRLARRIAWVMFWKRMVTRETLLNPPKPLAHLFRRSLGLCSKGVLEEGDELTEI